MREDEEWGVRFAPTPHSFALALLVCERKVPTMRRLVLLVVIGWIVLVTVLHLWLNLHAFDVGPRYKDKAGLEFRVGYLPVT